MYASFPLQFIHSNVWITLLVSINSYQCYVHFIDEFFMFTWIYFLKRKNDVLKAFLNFKSQVQL